ncbi:MAG: VOC family protein [Desulfovibrio sp.]|nr:MAG: VOC family protein [Desulfovibrio sp.]
MTLDPKTHGVFSWNELMTTDLDGAKEFYGGLFGWEFEEMVISDGPMAGTPYISGKINGEYVGGMMTKPPEPAHIPPHWGAYITVDNIENTLGKVKELGGNVIMPKTPIKDMGAFAVIQDPQGAVVSIFEFMEE